jgi:hypothetical protein
MFQCSRWPGRRFEEQNLRFVIGAGAALDAAQNDNAFAGAHFDNVSELDAKPALPDQEEFVFLLMLVGRRA